MLFAEEEMRAWSFWSAAGQVKGPHGKGTHPSDWGLGAARAPRKTVLKTVKMRFILRKHKTQGLVGVKSSEVLWSDYVTQEWTGGERTAQADVRHGINQGTVEQIPGLDRAARQTCTLAAVQTFTLLECQK